MTDARDALETVARRSEGLLHFVQNHRRLTKPLVTQMQVAPVERVFARVQRLLATELATNDIQMTTSVEPQTLELAADADLLDQALINLVRNAIEALADVAAGRIATCPGAGIRTVGSSSPWRTTARVSRPSSATGYSCRSSRPSVKAAASA